MGTIVYNNNNIIFIGHVLALYYMAEIYGRGLNGRKSCKQAVEVCDIYNLEMVF